MGLCALFEELLRGTAIGAIGQQTGFTIDADLHDPSGTGILRSGTCCRAVFMKSIQMGWAAPPPNSARPRPRWWLSNRSRRWPPDSGYNRRNQASRDSLVVPVLPGDVVTLEGHGLPASRYHASHCHPRWRWSGVGDEEALWALMVCGAMLLGTTGSMGHWAFQSAVYW